MMIIEPFFNVDGAQVGWALGVPFDKLQLLPAAMLRGASLACGDGHGTPPDLVMVCMTRDQLARVVNVPPDEVGIEDFAAGFFFEVHRDCLVVPAPVADSPDV
jgi:hypothetical protein